MMNHETADDKAYGKGGYVENPFDSRVPDYNSLMKNSSSKKKEPFNALKAQGIFDTQKMFLTSDPDRNHGGSSKKHFKSKSMVNDTLNRLNTNLS